ncbi:hypothetical protein MAM1_0353d09966 [Mucor ambiguus]|uniref:Uncharacterized protein n=1 Tax=Mucor ambiguus TaxID=91626 RepID=A0A0C9LXS9_9FUNG|nr:hypothetical protein MAM1_0353d09966 [Mucor ambiguus]
MSDKNFTLPLVYKPSPDLMGKIILSDKRVMNAITKCLVNTSEDVYQVASTQFMHSPLNCVLYVAKPESAYPPIIINMTEIVNDTFISQAIRCCTETYEEYCHEHFGPPNIPFAKESRCDLWTTEYLLVSKDAMLNNDDPRHPLIEILNGIVKYNWICLSENGLVKLSDK